MGDPLAKGDRCGSINTVRFNLCYCSGALMACCRFTANSEESSGVDMNGTFCQPFLTRYAPVAVKLATASGSVRFQARLMGFAQPEYAPVAVKLTTTSGSVRFQVRLVGFTQMGVVTAGQL